MRWVLSLSLFFLPSVPTLLPPPLLPLSLPLLPPLPYSPLSHSPYCSPETGSWRLPEQGGRAETSLLECSLQGWEGLSFP